MAGEIFIARQDTLEEVKQTVNEIDTNVDTVNTTTTNTKAETANIKTDTDGLKLSTDSIKQIADTILERIGLTTDVGGGANTGTVLGKLNALFSSGGGISGFKYTDKTTSSSAGTTYTTRSSGIVLSEDDGVYIRSGGKIIKYFEQDTQYYGTKYGYIGIFTKGAVIEVDKNRHAHIFEFI